MKESHILFIHKNLKRMIDESYSYFSVMTGERLIDECRKHNDEMVKQFKLFKLKKIDEVIFFKYLNDVKII
jgi:hypothetical protein